MYYTKLNWINEISELNKPLIKYINHYCIKEKVGDLNEQVNELNDVVCILIYLIMHLNYRNKLSAHIKYK